RLASAAGRPAGGLAGRVPVAGGGAESPRLPALRPAGGNEREPVHDADRPRPPGAAADRRRRHLPGAAGRPPADGRDGVTPSRCAAEWTQEKPMPDPTPLHDVERAAGAEFAEVAGWLVPARYGDLTAEYDRACTGAAVFDLSHRGKVELTGPDAP